MGRKGADENAMKIGLFKHGPLAAGINAEKLSAFYKGGIIDDLYCNT